MNDATRTEACTKLEQIATLLTTETGAEIVRAAAALVFDKDFAEVRFGLRNLISIVIGFARSADSVNPDRAAGLMLAHAVLVDLLEE